MILNQIKYKWQNNYIEFAANILSSMAGDKYASFSWGIQELLFSQYFKGLSLVF